MNSLPRIVIIGAGNVASHLAPALARHAHVTQVCATSAKHAQDLCDKIGQGRPVDDVTRLDTDADCYLICVKDSEIAAVVSTMPHVQGVVAHTSGSVNADVLATASSHYGVMYPLQTFSKNVDVDMSKIPFFTEASDARALDTLDRLAECISDVEPKHISSDDRALLHLAAVFACNFSNLLWGAADGIMRSIGCTLADLRPLITTTLDKAIATNPADAQTGPASRGDFAVMARQESLLSRPWDNIYSALSQAIAEKRLNQPILKP